MRSDLLHEIAGRFPGKRVLVVGDLMLDEYLWGEVRRISPEAPVPVVEMQRRTCAPGGAANTAANVASLGGQAFLGGLVGKDREADQLAELLRRAGVDAGGFVADEACLTTTKTRIIAHSQQIVRVDREQRAGFSGELEERLLSWVSEMLGSVEACILSDYAKGVVSPRLAEGLIRQARQARVPVVVDPKGNDYGKYRGATVVKPNVHEAEGVLKRELRREGDWAEASRQLRELLPGTAFLISRGPEGMSLVREDGCPLHIPSVAREVFDVTGAGDTVVSALALALASEATLEQAAHLANRAAGLAVAKVGTAAVTLEELQHRLGVRRGGRAARSERVRLGDSR